MSVRAAGRHPATVDAAVALLTMAVCGIIRTGRTGATVSAPDLIDWVTVVLLPLPLFWRSRAPVIAFWSVIVLLCLSATLGAESPAAFLVELVALHAVARRRPARFVWPAVAGAILPGFGSRLDEAATLTAFTAVSAVTVATALIGMNQRTRNAYLNELEDRARTLERDRDQRARLAVADERARIAREMHDIVAHHLTVMVALAEGAAATVPADPPRATGVMQQVSATGRQALTEMRRLLGLLRTDADGPSADVGSLRTDKDGSRTNAGGLRTDAGSLGTDAGSLQADAERLRADGGGLGIDAGRLRTDGGGREPQPGLGDLDALTDRIRAAGIEVTLIRSGTPGTWGPGAGLVVHRIVQESLTNTLKHAGPPATAEVRISYDTGGTTIDVTDDGAGRSAPTPEPAGRHGLTGMRERAAAYGGWLEAGPRDGPGWRVRAHLPFTTVPGATAGHPGPAA